MSKATHVSRPYVPLADEHNVGAYNKYASLPSILRDCAVFVERNEFHPILYQALSLLHQYAGENAGKKTVVIPPSSLASGGIPTTATTSIDEAEVELEAASFPIPEDRSGSPTPTTISSSSGGNSKSRETVKKFSQFGKNIGSAFKGTEKVLGEALSKIHVSHKSGSSSSHVDEDTGLYRSDEHSTTMGGYKNQESHSQTPVMTTSNEIHARPQSSLPSLHPDSNAPLPNTLGVSSAPLNSTVAVIPNKPCFQRPINPKSNLIANGWIEQQRRSKMRVIWKDILASLVEGRKAKEETTLWIQRQVTNPATGKQELEALHQIPMKWIEDVTYVNMYGDHRFSIKIFNVQEEFQFRTRDADSANNWVVTLLSAVEASNKGIMMSNVTAPPLAGSENSVSNFKNEDDNRSSTPASLGVPTDKPESRGDEPKHFTIKELRAIAEKAGIDTRGMERSELERIAARYQQPSNVAEQASKPNPFESSRFQSSDFAGATRVYTEEEQRKRQIEEQERRRQQQEEQERRRRQLEEQERKRQLAEEEFRRRQLEEQERSRKIAEEEFRRRQLEEQERKRQLAEEEYKRRQLEEQERSRKLAEEEFRRRQLEEQERKRQLAAEEEYKRRQLEEQERNRKLAEEEFRRRQLEEQERKQQLEEQERKRKLAEEEYRRRMAWQQQQQNMFQQHSNGSAAPPQQGPNQQGSLKDKYAHIMEQRSEEDEQAAITAIKRNILIHWALLPPRFNTLRPIEHLVVSIQTCFPPAFGVKEHEFFQKWKPIVPSELVISAAMGNTPNAEKLKKAVRKIRFFLHPDKRPKDLSAEQEFMCKMLWDITSDAWDEFCSKHEELDWLRS